MTHFSSSTDFVFADCKTNTEPPSIQSCIRKCTTPQCIIFPPYNWLFHQQKKQQLVPGHAKQNFLELFCSPKLSYAGRALSRILHCVCITINMTSLSLLFLHLRNSRELHSRSFPKHRIVFFLFSSSLNYS